MNAFGAVCEFVVAEIPGVVGGEPTIVSVPLDAWAWADRDVDPRAGRAVRVPFDPWVLSNPAPRVSGGNIVGVPFTTWAWSDKTPRVSISVFLRVPADPWIVEEPAPELGGGFLVGVEDVRVFNFDFGTVAEGVLVEFARLEGAASTKIVRRPETWTWTDRPVALYSGGGVRVPADAWVWTDQRVEVSARRRKLKIFTVTS